MSEANKEIVRRVDVEGFAGGDTAVLDELLAEDYVDHFAPPGLEPGREGAKAFVAMLHRAFSNVELSVEDIMAEGDRVAVRWQWTADHVGDFMGVPASNKHVVVTGVEIDRLADGRLAESWTQVDFAGFLMQVGALPMPGG